MTKFVESDVGSEREGFPGLPFAGNVINDLDSLLDFYFGHPTSVAKGNGPGYGYSDGYVPSRDNHEKT